MNHIRRCKCGREVPIGQMADFIAGHVACRECVDNIGTPLQQGGPCDTVLINRPGVNIEINLANLRKAERLREALADDTRYPASQVFEEFNAQSLTPYVPADDSEVQQLKQRNAELLNAVKVAASTAGREWLSTKLMLCKVAEGGVCPIQYEDMFDSEDNPIRG